MEFMEDNTYLAIGSILDRRYEIKRHLASGGFGKTYLVTTKLGGHKKVVKEFFLSSFCERDAERKEVTISVPKNKEIFDTQKRKFLREAERCHSMEHPNIVWVSDLFEANGTAYYVMDYVDGETLEDKMQKLKGKPMPEDEVMRYLNQMLSALEYVHAKGFLHLDIKPGNIMVDKAGNAMLIDFGASKQFDIDSDEHDVVTTTAGLAYTPGYAPFEQQMGRIDALGPYSDIYALGATLYRLLVAKKPPTAMEIQEQGMPKMDNITPVLANVITKSMAFSRNDRLGSVAEIRALLNNETPCAQPGNINNDETICGENAATQVVEDRQRDTIRKTTKKSRYVWGAAAGVVAVVVGVVMSFMLMGSSETVETVKFADFVETIGNETFDMVAVEGGTFKMGATPEQGEDVSYERSRPVHDVTLDNYYIGKTEVTQALWNAVMGNELDEKSDYLMPVRNVSWDEACDFCARLSEMTGKKYHLPTEAQWEYAARGGNKSNGYRYSGSNELGDVAWNIGNSENKVHAVALKKANELGLYDMSGNVSEWCLDWWHDGYPAEPQMNPQGEPTGEYRVHRGGNSWFDAVHCVVSDRGRSPKPKGENLGFRLAMTP